MKVKEFVFYSSLCTLTSKKCLYPIAKLCFGEKEHQSLIKQLSINLIYCLKHAM